MSTEANQSFDAAEAALRSGDRKNALSGLLIALALEPDNPVYRRAALNILSITSGYKSLPAPVLDALRACTSDPALDLQPLSLVIKTLFEADARFVALEQTLEHSAAEIEGAIIAGAWDWFFNEPMLLGVLARATLIGMRLEHVLRMLRRHILLNSSALAARYQNFLTAVVLQLDTARFPWTVSPEERDALQSAPSPLVQALYRPLLMLDAAAASQLPDVLHAARNTLLVRHERAASMPVLTHIEDPTSQTVRDQYEGFPYPPWDALGDIQPTTLTQFVTARFPKIDLKNLTPAILSAGCGTGRGAIMLALTFPDATLTALDLSGASLAYASLKAEQHGVTNVSFGVGDILKVKTLGQTFDLIESSGVLHHMADPAAGLRALASVLKPHGLMRIALYSERGRGAVIAARQIIADHQISDTDDGVRRSRQILLALPAGHPARGVVDTPEFFTLDGLHDLIFNVQESRYTPRGLKDLLTAAELEFLGFDLADAGAKQTYSQLFPADPAACDLDNWEVFERNHPNVFAEMYQLWCRRSE